MKALTASVLPLLINIVLEAYVVVLQAHRVALHYLPRCPMKIGDNAGEEFHVSLFPNPATDIINVRMKDDITNGEITIYDINGKLIMLQKISGSTTLDVSSFSSGIYMVQLRADNLTSQIEKLIVE